MTKEDMEFIEKLRELPIKTVLGLLCAEAERINLPLQSHPEAPASEPG